MSTGTTAIGRFKKIRPLHYLRQAGPRTRSIIYIALLTPISFGLSEPFCSSFWVCLVCAICLALILTRSCQQFFRSRQNDQKREHYLCLLQFLCGELASGSNLYRALLKGDRVLLAQLGEKSLIYQGLHAGANLLRLQEKTALALQTIGQKADFPEARDLFYLLASSEDLGNRHLFLLKDAVVAQQKITAVNREIQSEQFAVVAEALALLTMPFLVGTAFKGMYGQLQVSRRQPVAACCSLLAFSLSLAAIALTTHILWPKAKQNKDGARSIQPSDFARRFFRFCCQSRPLCWCAAKLLPNLPQNYTLHLKRQHGLLLNQVRVTEDEKEQAVLADLSRRLVSILWLSVLLTVPLVMGRLPPIALLGLPAPWFYGDYKLHREGNALIRQFQKDLPFYLEALLQYLTGGFVPVKAMSAAARSGEEGQKPLYCLLSRLAGDIKFQGNFSTQLLNFSLRLNNISMQSIFLLLSQYAENGHEETLTALNNQKYICWELYRKSVTAEQKLTAGKLLLPMAADLIAVMLVALAPALSIFTSI